MSKKEHSCPERVQNTAHEGDLKAAEDLLPRVYAELKKVAREKMVHLPPGQTLQPTALVHEAYLRLVGNADPGWNSKRHFFGAAARAMRNILVEKARHKESLKTGGDRTRVDLDWCEPAFHLPSIDVLAVDEAVRQLEKEDPRKGQIVNFRYFARLNTKETAAALGIAPSTVRREWRYIRTWLEHRLRRGE